MSVDISEEILMFYNVENLFLPDPKPVHKLDPTKSGLRNWDERKYINKINKISYVFKLIEQDFNRLPLLVGLSEIQGKPVLNDLVSQQLLSRYDYIHYESMDERGVDVAMLYDKNKIKILHSEPISFFFEIEDQNPENYDTTRDVLYCKLSLDNIIINIFVVHLPSKREKDINEPKREFILKEINDRISKIIHLDDEPVIVLGDFNSDPDEPIMKNFVFDKKNQKILINPYFNLFIEKKFSTFYHKNGLLFDQIIISKHFFEPYSVVRFKKALIYSSKLISSKDSKFLRRPYRTYSGTRYLGGYSDHFPVITVFEKKF